MTAKNEKNFGVWMDTHSATVAGTDGEGNFAISGRAENPGPEGNSSENAANNHEITLTHKFFKEIASLMPNAEKVHLTGTGQIQEQFASYLADTAQYKDVQASQSTSNRMGDEALCGYFEAFFK